MGWWSDLTGASAAKEAAADTYAKQQAAVKGITDYGDKYRNEFSTLARSYDPYTATGYTANNQLQNLLSNPSSVGSLPGYQFALDQGVKGLVNSAAGRGMLNSGAAGKDVLKYATGYADQTYGNQLARLMAASGQGLGATTAQNAMEGQGLQGQLGTRQSAYQGNMNSAGTIGQGDIAAANANTSFINNLLSTAATIGGAALGGPMGAAMGGSLGKLMGGGGNSSIYSNPTKYGTLY